MTYDLAILGLGIAGLAVSFRIKNKTIVILGKTDDTASRCATGVTTHKGLITARGELFQLKERGHKNLPKWIDEVSQSTHQKISIHYGVEEHFLSEQDGKEIQQRIYRDCALENFAVKKIKEGFLYPEDYVFDVNQLLNSLLFHANAAHTVIHSHACKILRKADFYTIITDDAQPIQAKSILIACGKDAQAVTKSFGLGDLDVNFLAGKTFYGHLTTEKGSQFSQKALTHRGRNISALNEIFRIGSTASNEALEEDLADFEALRRHFGCSLSPSGNWLGVRTRFRDRLPKILLLERLSSTQKIYFLGGYYKSGFQFADLMAQEFIALFDGNNQRAFSSNSGCVRDAI